MRVIGIVAEYNPFHTGARLSNRLHPGTAGGGLRRCSGNERPLGAEAGGLPLRTSGPGPGWPCWGGRTWCWNCPRCGRFPRRRPSPGGRWSCWPLPEWWTCSPSAASAGIWSKLRRAAVCLDGPEYEAGCAALWRGGPPFAAARQRAVEGLLGPELAELLSTPNNNLGVEYLRALDSLNHANLAHDRPAGGRSPRQSAARGRSGPAVLLRHPAARLFGAGDWNGPGALPPQERAGSAARRAGAASRLGAGGAGPAGPPAHHDRGGLGPLPDSGAGEGLPPRLERAGRQCRSLEEFFALAKPKHWTQARMRRLLVWACLGLTREDRPDRPPISGCWALTAGGRTVLKEMKERAASAHPHQTRPRPQPGRARGGGSLTWRPGAPTCTTCAWRPSPPPAGSGPPARSASDPRYFSGKESLMRRFSPQKILLPAMLILPALLVLLFEGLKGQKAP